MDVPESPLETQWNWIRREKDACAQRSWIHNQARRRFHALDVSSLATVIVLSTFASAVSLFGDACKDKWIKIVVGVVNLSVTGLTSWYGFHKYGERKRKHERTRDAYCELARKLEVEDRLHGTEEHHFRTPGSLISYTRNRIDRIETESPNLPGELEKRYQTIDEEPLVRGESTEEVL